MSGSDRLHDLAHRAGLSLRWQDYRGRPQTVPDDTVRTVLRAMGHEAGSEAQAAESSEYLAQSDSGGSCMRVGETGPRQRLWGLAAQIYALRGPGDCGIGGFRELRTLCEVAAPQGADAVMINPVHAAYAADGNSYSPYSPSSRLFLNPVYADPSVLFPGFDPATFSGGNSPELIEWAAAHGRRYAALRSLWQAFQPELEGDGERAGAFRAFCREGGEALQHHALFEALHGSQYARDPGLWDWRRWDAGLRSPQAAPALEFAGLHAGELAFHKFAQWLTQASLLSCQQSARAAGMQIGVIADIAVGTQPGGSQAWSDTGSFLTGVTIGAPPDDLNPRGQNWGLTAYSPPALRAAGYAPFARMLEASMRGAGGIRIDHILGLNRLWLIPEGAEATQGVYLRYPLDDLLALTARLSQQRRCIVIGEDLGTVPDGLRERLAARNILGLQVLEFMTQGERFIAPQDWSANAVAVTSTHDLPTATGWQLQRDIAHRSAIGQYRDGEEQEARLRRGREQAALADALRGERLPADGSPAQIAASMAGYVARTHSPLALYPLEDLCGQDEQTNLPGTVHEHPNWRRRMTLASSDLLDREPAASALEQIRRGRHPP